MAEYLIQDTTLTSLGDSIRDLNDTTSTMTPAQMKSTVDGAVDEIESQTALIAQCLSALEGKVSGGGSGSGGAVETCTLTFNSNTNYTIHSIDYSQNIDGIITMIHIENQAQLNPSVTLENIVVGSILVIRGINLVVENIPTGITVFYQDYESDYATRYYILALNTSGQFVLNTKDMSYV